MTIHISTQNEFLLAPSLNEIYEAGIVVDTGTDFEQYREILKTARPDHSLGVPFDPERQPINAENSYWIVGYDLSGNVVHTQALKRLDLPKKVSLGEYMSNNLCAFEPPMGGIDYEQSHYNPGPGARSMTGCITYHGEFWIGGTPGQFRGTGMCSLLARHAFLSAYLRWRPDYFFGLMSKPLVHKGFSARFGYMHIDQDAISFAFKDKSDIFEVVMGYNSKVDLRFLLNIEEEEEPALFDKAA